MNSARRDYFSNIIAENSSNQRSCFVQPIHCYLSWLMSGFQITYLPMIWLIILATIFYRRLNVSMTHWTPFSHLSFLTAMAMRSQITWRMRKLCRSWSTRICRVPKLQELDTRPSFFDYWKGSHEILFFRSCTYICGSTGSWCAVTGNYLYDQHVVWIWSVRSGMGAGPRITHVKEVWSTVRKFLYAIPFRSIKGCRKGHVLARFCSRYIPANYSM